jgi:AraC family transcriptional regulator
MAPRLIHKPALTILGLRCQMAKGSGTVDALWEALSQRYREMPHADPDVGYGVHTWASGGDDYLAGLALRRSGPTPDGMFEMRFPPQLYALFTHMGRMALLESRVRWVLDAWLPQSGYRQAGAYYLEYYDDRFLPEAENSVMFLLFPIKK